jgi:hypothetical protein
MLNACVQKFDVMENLENFAKFSRNHAYWATTLPPPENCNANPNPRKVKARVRLQLSLLPLYLYPYTPASLLAHHGRASAAADEMR